MSMEFTDNPLDPLPRPAYAEPIAVYVLLSISAISILSALRPKSSSAANADDVIVRPIAGTRLRGKTPAEDLANDKTC